MARVLMIFSKEEFQTDKLLRSPRRKPSAEVFNFFHFDCNYIALYVDGRSVLSVPYVGWLVVLGLTAL